MAMKVPGGLLPAVLLVLAGCSDYVDVPVSYQKQPIKVAKCKPIVNYQGTSFKTSGVEIPIPQLGGNTKVGEVSLTPETLNTLYKEVAILDALRLQYCDARLAAAQVSLAAFQAANNRMLDQEEKIANLALSTTQGEAQAQKALDTITNAPAPKPDPTTQKVDNTAVAAAKQQAQQVTSPGAPNAGAPAPSPTPSAVAPPLPPPVAAVVKTVSTSKLLKAARSKPPRKAPTPAMHH
jgi:hypothetical protein